MRRLALFLLMLSVSLSGCTFSMDWFRHFRVARALERQDYEGALTILQKIIQSDPDSDSALRASREGARIAHLDAGNYTLAVEFYKHIVLRSPDAEERRSAQKYIAQIHFENIHDYDQAVVEYEKLLSSENNPEGMFHYRLNLAKCHLQLNNIDQALDEIEILIAHNNSADQAFEAKALKANTLIAAKRQAEGASLLEGIIKEFPEKARKENVALNLVVCYEDMKDFKKAIEVLENMRKDNPHPDFLDVRIQRLRGRMMNQPGAQGLKR